jgi:ankyrin repeat protein
MCLQEGNTALHCAAKDGFAEVVRKMIDYGADKNLTNAVRAVAAEPSAVQT